MPTLEFSLTWNYSSYPEAGGEDSYGLLLTGKKSLTPLDDNSINSKGQQNKRENITMDRIFIYRRPIRWGDTDAAGIVFTAHYFDMCMEAIEAWFIKVIGEDWYTMSSESNIGTPFVHAEIDFSSPMTPKDALSIIVEASHVGNSSLGFSVEGEKDESRESVFSGKFTCCFCDMGNFEPIEMPEALKAKVKRYNIMQKKRA